MNNNTSTQVEKEYVYARKLENFILQLHSLASEVLIVAQEGDAKSSSLLYPLVSAL
jgi:hypothetical protein